MKHSVLSVPCACILAFSFAFLLNAQCFADVYQDMEEAEKALEEAKISYDESVQAYEESNAAFIQSTDELTHAQDLYATKLHEARKAANYLYKTSDNKYKCILEMMLTGDSLQDILQELDMLKYIFEYQSTKLSEVQTAYNTAQEASKLAEEAYAQNEQNKANMEQTLNEALETYNTAQQAIDEYETQQAAEKKRSSQASQTSSSSSAAKPPSTTESEVTMSVSQFLFSGVVYANGYRYTYYSESVLPGPGLNIPGRHTADGMVLDGDGYLCVASSDLPKGTVVPTILGRPGKVYDSGCASGTLDLYLA